MGSSPCGIAFVARHGQTASNLRGRYAGRSDEPLTPEGRAEAAALVRRVAPYGIAEVWTSRIARARETADLVAAALRVPVHLDPRLDEMLLGPWEGLTEAEAAARFPEAYGLWLTRPDRVELPGRETLAQVAERACAAVSDAAARRQPTLLISHVAPIRVAALAHLGLPLRYYKRVSVANAAAIEIEPEAGRVRRIGSKRQLSDELRLSAAAGEVA